MMALPPRPGYPRGRLLLATMALAALGMVVILGLSLANRSFLAFTCFAAMASLLLFYPSIYRKENPS